MATATVTSRGQVTIPDEVRASLGLSAGDRLEFVPLGEGKYALIASKHTISDLKGMIKKSSSPVSIEDMNTAIESSGAGNPMEVTISIDDKLYQQALELAEPGLDKPSDLLDEAIKTYVRVQAARRLAASGGEAPDMRDIPRRGEARDLDALIIECIEKKRGSQEFALFFNPNGKPAWEAMLGNEMPVPLGESSGEFKGLGATPEEAVEDLQSNFLSGTLNEDYHWLLALSLTPWLEDFAEGREYSMWDDEDRIYNDLMDFMRSGENPALKG